MTVPNWADLEILFEQVRDLPEAQRDAVLEAANVDAGLRAELLALVRAADSRHRLSLERWVPDETRPRPDDDEAWVGHQLGSWRVSRVLARGGMGVVYAAERADGQFQHEVAVKVLRRGLRDPHAIERFRTERQLLASLTHPHIARLLDGGLASDGTPYLVMELVDGVPITRWVAEQRPSFEARLRLLRDVCAAVQHAHRALVVHRDLKPSNILVTGEGGVKLLDFGIAKLLEPAALGLDRTDTRVELRALTPAYAAPEQIAGGPVTTATDVYALGIVLHELMTGARPQDAGVDVVAPSEQARRSGDPRSARRLEGDVDRVVLTARAVDPDRRYASAGQLGDEIQRLLDGRPIAARPDTLGYRARMFVRRNRLVTGLAAMFVLSLTTFAGFFAWQSSILAEQRRLAQVERDTANHVVGVLTDLFASTNPSVRPGGDRMPIGEFLAGAEQRSLQQLRETPAVQARLQQVLGRIHLARGAPDDARRALEAALETQQELGGTNDPEGLESLRSLGDAYAQAGDMAQARALLEDALTRHRARYGSNDLRTAAVMHSLAPVVAAANFDQAGALLDESLRIRRAALAPDDVRLGESLASLGGYHFRRRELDDARRYYEQALDVFRDPVARRNPTAISLLGDYATLMGQLDDHAKAAELQREALLLGREVVGRDSLVVANLLNNSGTTQQMLGRHDVAEPLYRESFEVHQRLLGSGHLRTRNAARNVARALVLQQRHGEALTWFDRAVTLPLADDGELRAGVLGMRAQRAAALAGVDQGGRAVREAREVVTALETMASASGADSLSQASARAVLGNARVILGRLLTNANRPGEAVPVLEAALETYGTLATDHPRRAEAECELARAHLSQGRVQVEQWKALAACLPRYRRWALAERQPVATLTALLAGQP